MNLAGVWTHPQAGGAGPDYPACRWNLIKPLLPEMAGLSCLDVGCSSGFFSATWAMRDIISLACGTCQRRNYSTTKNRRTHPDRMELKKYCRWCRKHTPHKETK